VCAERLRDAIDAVAVGEAPAPEGSKPRWRACFAGPAAIARSRNARSHRRSKLYRGRIRPAVEDRGILLVAVRRISSQPLTNSAARCRWRSRSSSPAPTISWRSAARSVVPARQCGRLRFQPRVDRWHRAPAGTRWNRNRVDPEFGQRDRDHRARHGGQSAFRMAPPACASSAANPQAASIASQNVAIEKESSRGSRKTLNTPECRSYKQRKRQRKRDTWSKSFSCLPSDQDSGDQRPAMA